LIAAHPDKLLWPDLLKFFKKVIPKKVDDYVSILSKMDISMDPGSQMDGLDDIFA
jgi:hypothetical protein